jgi:hypothetical protein
MNQDLTVKFSSSNNQSVNIYIPEEIDLILLSFSAGTDSSLLLYLICDYLIKTKRTHIRVVARHCVDVAWAPKTRTNFNNILDQFDIHFPEIKILRHAFNRFENYKNPGSKGKSLGNNLFTIADKHNGKIITFSAGTCNPPKEVQDEYGVFDKRDPGRDIDNAKNEDSFYFMDKNGNKYLDFINNNVLFSKPFLLVNKKFVADHYQRIDFLKNNIFHLTTSCVERSPHITNSWAEPCKKCWWCKEKYWAFGKYDYEKLES